MMQDPVLVIEDLHVSLPKGGDREYAVNGMSLTIKAGEIVCLLGESGSGKSVIAHAVMGLLPHALKISKGTITVLGDDIVAVSADALAKMRGQRMSMVFQEPMTALNPVQRCGAQIEELLLIHGVKHKAERAARAMDILNQVQFADPLRVYKSFPHQLSGGQRQRVMIALALTLKPALLICDEPTTALDVTTQAEILKLLLDLRKKTGTAILFITHDIGVAEQIADHVVVMRLGDSVESGSCEEVLAHPRTDYTKKLIDSIPSLEPLRKAFVPVGRPMLSINHLHNAYRKKAWFGRSRETIVASDINIEVHSGETIGIVGESGSGKSSLARCVARLAPFDSGEIIVDGISIGGRKLRSEVREIRNEIQMIFQDPYRSLNPRRTVLDSLIEGPMEFGLDRSAAVTRAKMLMTRVRLPESVLDRYPHEFSGGQRQRICIARALACQPKLLIADEAVSALDVSVQAEILDLLEEMQRQYGLAMVFITHDLRVAARLCDRIVVLQNGKVVEQGAASAVLTQPTSLYTQTLLAAVPSKKARVITETANECQ